ncbi:ester cyclase [Candidatus Bipolaricaulota bacterium]|nr:ester cyclase [Candidatus Bipolaricaulota bacterium]
MSTEQNKTIARRHVEEGVGKRNLSVVDELLATNFVLHATPPSGVPLDREGYKKLVSMIHTGFSDYRVTVEDMVAEGDRVVIRLTMRGTHKGEFMGITPTGKHVTWTGITILRIEGGKIVEIWNQVDSLGLMQQLGVVPPPGQGE